MCTFCKTACFPTYYEKFGGHFFATRVFSIFVDVSTLAEKSSKIGVLKVQKMFPYTFSNLQYPPPTGFTPPCKIGYPGYCLDTHGGGGGTLGDPKTPFWGPVEPPKTWFWHAKTGFWGPKRRVFAMERGFFRKNPLLGPVETPKTPFWGPAGTQKYLLGPLGHPPSFPESPFDSFRIPLGFLRSLGRSWTARLRRINF